MPGDYFLHSTVLVHSFPAAAEKMVGKENADDSGSQPENQWAEKVNRPKLIAKDVNRTCQRWGLLFPICIALLMGYSYLRVIEHLPEESPELHVFLEMLAALWTHVLWFCSVVYPILTVFLYCKNIGREWLIPTATAQACAVFLCWNTHLVSYTTFNCVFAASGNFSSYSGILSEYFLFVVFVPSPTCVLTATGKHLARRYGNRCYKRDEKIDTAVMSFLFTFPLAVGYLVHRYYFAIERMPSIAANTLLWWTYFFSTYPGSPQDNGSRQRTVMINGWRRVWNLAQGYLSLKVILDDEEARLKGNGKAATPADIIGYDPEGKENGCLFGFHPHGIIPYTAGLMYLHPRFQELLPGVLPHYMTDSFIHSVPGIRDGSQMLGAREVSRANVKDALSSGLCTMIVPGGQVEIFTTKSYGKNVILTRKHKGFIRMAIQYGASLVPILSMGEWILMDNVELSFLQKWSRAFLGFPVPFIPYGAFIAIPRRCPITIIIGKPIKLPKPKSADFVPSQKEVEKVHEQYFNQLRDMFERNKVACGFPRHSLVFDDEITDKKQK